MEAKWIASGYALAMTTARQAKENVIASEERAKQSRKGW
jgi:hypothetical protein